MLPEFALVVLIALQVQENPVSLVSILTDRGAFI